MGDLSPHFDTSEFRCHHCGQVKVDPRLPEALERLREAVRRPIRIVSGYRCPAHNRAVAGAPGSRHMLGQAADLVLGLVIVTDARHAGFTGIGTKGPWAVHVDVRPDGLAVFRD